MPRPEEPAGLPPSLQGLGRCLVMGILNVTPDSFSDGDRFADPQAAFDHGMALHRAGADIVDVGGESTRPGARRVSGGEEADRVLAVITALAAAGVPVSIDTMRSETAAAAVRAGAAIVNDVSGGLADPLMAGVVADLEVPYVVMHWRAHSTQMNEWAQYGPDVVGDVCQELQVAVQGALFAGVRADRIVVDPGLGFAKDSPHNWALLAGLDRLTALGYPVLIGASRKRFLGELLATADGPRPVAEREAATAAVSVLAAAGGAWCVRVHDVAATQDAVRVVAATLAAGHDPH